MAANLEKLSDELSTLTVLELSELSKKLEEKWGVSAASFAAAAPAPTAAVDSGDSVEVKDKFELVLVAAGDSKINVIKEVRAITGLGLKEAKDLVDSAPKPLKSDVPKEEAEEYVKRVKSSGATPGRISSYWVSDENMNRIEDPVVAKGDGIEITQDEMEKLHKNGRVRLKDGSLLVFPSKPLKVKEDDIDEASMTGTGASFNAGSGEGYMTPKAFKKKKKK